MEGVEGEMQQGPGMEVTAAVTLEELYIGNLDRKESVRRRVVCRR
jgi:hypothetical protein